MGNEWPNGTPQWQQQGRSGPNGPVYASGKDRRSVRRTGKPTGKNPKESLIDKILHALKGRK
jgi:hypothetical protein